MAGLCKAIVIGNLGRDPEKRYTQDGRAMARFSVAASTRRKDRDGNWQDHTEWFNVTLFGRQAETLADRLTKGSRVYVEGRLESRTYETANGGKGFAMDLVVNELILIDPRQRDEGQYSADGTNEGPAAAPAPPRPAASGSGRSGPAGQADDSDFEDLPF